MRITLKAARVNSDLTQKEAAKLLNISVETLCNYENGISFPNVPTLKKIERVYDVCYSDLIFLTANNA